MNTRCPVWATAAALVTRRLPVARYRAIEWLPRHATPFTASFPADPRLRFTCDPSDAISREVFFAGSYEPQLTLIARALVESGNIVVDAGANWGYFTLLCAGLVSATGRVISFEPEPGLFARLNDHIAVNALGHVSAHRLALGASGGPAWLQLYDTASGNRGTSRLVGGEEPNAIAVERAALDEVLDRSAVDTVDLVKIDVEGAEPDVLGGMAAGLGRGRYRHVIVEWHPLATPAPAIAESVRRLESRGYVAWSIDHSPEATRLAAYRGVVRLLPAELPVDARWPHWLVVRRDQQAKAFEALRAIAPRS
jgi:FkbM family methyltransferase